MTTTGQVRLLADGDLDALAGFCARWPGETVTAAAWRTRFDHWWKRNPWCTPSTPRGWLLLDGARIGGFFGLVPVPFQSGGQEVIAFGSTTWRVDPDLRHLSLTALASALKACKETLLFVWTGTPTLIKILDKLKFRPLLRPAYFRGRQPSLLLLSPGRALASFGRAPALARVAGAPLIGHAAVAWMRGRIASRGMSVERVTHADSRFDDLWQRTRKRVDNTNVRSAAYLDWHCFGGGTVGKWLFACAPTKSAPLSGMLIACVKHARGLRVLEVADVWTDTAEPRALEALFAQLIADGWRAGMDAIELPHFDDALHALARRHALLPRAPAESSELVLAKPATLDAMTLENCYFTGMHGDRWL